MATGESCNVNESPVAYDHADLAGYRAAAARLSRELGAEELNLNRFEVAPGDPVRRVPPG